MEKDSEAREPEIVKYLATVRSMEKHFKGFTVEHIPRNSNNEADALAKVVAQNQALPPDVFYEVLTTPAVKEPKAETINVIEKYDWRAPMLAFLRGHYEPTEEVSLNCMKQRARGYEIIDGELYKSGISAPTLRCISFEVEKELLKEFTLVFAVPTSMGSSR
ncbi:reverse transcriptase-like protein, partial [Bifidobacterium breve]|uniref:reverse transcriptase-like protein n=1 Tax=Bifidobacterium breve TaxID=1685 RepID=UPI0005176AFC